MPFKAVDGYPNEPKTRPSGGGRVDSRSLSSRCAVRGGAAFARCSSETLTVMHIRPVPTAYRPPPVVPSESVKPRSAGFQQLHRQIAALQQEGEQATSASAESQAAVTVQQNQADIARTQKQANGSSAAAISSGSDEVPRGSSTGPIGQLIDVMA
jgi:hypothetical protein